MMKRFRLAGVGEIGVNSKSSDLFCEIFNINTINNCEKIMFDAKHILF